MITFMGKFDDYASEKYFNQIEQTSWIFCGFVQNNYITEVTTRESMP